MTEKQDRLYQVGNKPTKTLTHLTNNTVTQLTPPDI